MSKYTTGELAKLCNVTVRTVQYYDSRGILIPSELTDGGRRLYSEEDLKKLRVICFLRELDIPIGSISELLAEEHPENVISLLIEQQELVLTEEMNEKAEKLEKLNTLKKELKTVNNFTVESIGDIATIMNSKKKLFKVRRNLIIFGVPMTILEWASIILWIVTGIWWPFLIYTILCIPFSVVISKYYLDNVAYICPECHEVFKPNTKEAIFANHTPTTRKVTCTKCGHKGFCVETYGGKDND